MASSTFTAVDLSQLPAPNIVEDIDFETMFDEMLADLQARDTAFTALLPSDPAYKILEVCTYFRLLDRQRVNDAARGVMLAFATGGDLDQLGALLNVTRLVLDAGNPDEGVAATYESDSDFRNRIQLAPEGFSVAGPEGAYIYHTLSADSRALDASATSPEPDDIKAVVNSALTGASASQSIIDAVNAAMDSATWPGQVIVSVLSRNGDGTAEADLISTVQTALSSDDIRPLTDEVTVQSAEIVGFAIDATIYTYAGPDSSVVLANSQAALNTYLTNSKKLGRDITLSAIYAALSSAGVQRVELAQPVENIVIGRNQCASCTGITINYGGVDE